MTSLRNRHSRAAVPAVLGTFAALLATACGDSVAAPGGGYAPGEQVDFTNDGIIDGIAVDVNGDNIADGVDTNGDNVPDKNFFGGPYVPPAAGDGNGGDGSLNGDGSFGDGAGDGSGVVDDQIPCELQPILEAKCSLCHGAVPQYNAPMSLTKYQDFMAPGATDATKLVYQLVTERINHTNTSVAMPPVPQPDLTDSELAALNAWLSAGAPPNTVSCDPASGDGSGDGGGGGDGSGDGSGDGNAPEPSKCPDGECNPDRTGLDCYYLTAHSAGAAYNAKSTSNPKYKVGTATDKYYNFRFNAPWTGEAYGILLRPIIDNKQVIHHWLLFRGDGPVQNGSVGSSNGTHPDGELVHGWAPGGDMIDFRDYDADLGFGFVQGTHFTVEFHYNSSDPNAEDGSGVEICVVKEKPANLAGVSWLGTDAIFGASATGTCDPISNEPINILAVSPHMHLKGKHMKAVINRAGGGTELIHDGPFDFNNQTWFKAEHTLMPGDTVTTTCDYTGFSTFGTATTAEMCYLFTVHWPNGALTNGDTSIHGENSCLRAF